MTTFDVVNSWLSNVQFSSSGSKLTAKTYKRHLQTFANFIGKTPTQIIEDFTASTDREFRRRYAQYLRGLIAKMHSEGYAPNTIISVVTAIKSFFKYNDLLLGYVPTGMARIVYHNRDITREEIIQILAHSKLRDKAIFCMLAQSGLRPGTISKLRFEYIKEDYEAGTTPMKVYIPSEMAKGKFGSFFTFVGAETLKYLRLYLNTKPNIKPEDYIFTRYKTKRPISTKSLSNIFCKTVRKLEEIGLIDIKDREYKKPAEIRLYNLRKFFRKCAGQAGVEYVNFWMGHKTNYRASHIPSSDEHYFNREDVEFQRKLYAEKAMPFLRLETTTPTEAEKEIAELRRRLEERDEELVQLKENMKRMQPLLEFVNSFDAPKNLKEILDFLKDDYIRESSDEKLRPLRVEFSKYISNKLDEIARNKGITRKEALAQLVEEDLRTLDEGDKRFRKLEKRLRKRP